MHRERFKIQLPLSTNEPTPLALAYNRDHSVEGQFPYGEDLIRISRGRAKFFVMAAMDEDGILHIDEDEVADPGW